MKNRITSRPTALIVCLIFFFASAIMIWKMIEDGSTTQRTISAVGFALAGIVWTIILIGAKGKEAKMNEEDYKKYTVQARRGIKGEAFFEALISDYSIPHQIVGPKDIGIDYICEWVYGDKPTGVLYAVQVKTFSEQTAKPKFIEKNKLNELDKYAISNSNLIIDQRTLHYWKGLGIPVYLFAIVQTATDAIKQSLDCYYKRFTPVLTTSVKQEELHFSKVNDEASFIAFARPTEKALGFARDLFIDYMRWSYYKGSITYLRPETIGLDQFPEEDAVFVDLLKDYRDRVCLTYRKTKSFLEHYCRVAHS